MSLDESAGVIAASTEVGGIKVSDLMLTSRNGSPAFAMVVGPPQPAPSRDLPNLRLIGCDSSSPQQLSSVAVN